MSKTGNIFHFELTVVFALLPHERAPLSHRVVPLAVLAPDSQDVKERAGGAETVAAIDFRVQILKSKSKVIINYIKSEIIFIFLAKCKITWYTLGRGVSAMFWS